MCSSMEKRGEYIRWISEWPDTRGVKKINAHMSGWSSFPRQKSLFRKKNPIEKSESLKNESYVWLVQPPMSEKIFKKFNRHILKLKSSVKGTLRSEICCQICLDGFCIMQSLKFINYILILKNFISFSLSEALS